MRIYTRFGVLLLVALALAGSCDEATTPPDGGRATIETQSTDTEIASPTVGVRTVVELTDAAITKFKEFLATKPSKHIRLSVKNEGPTGFMYDLQIDDSINDSDLVDRSHGFTIVVDPKSSIYLDGATIDWQSKPDGQGASSSTIPPPWKTSRRTIA